MTRTVPCCNGELRYRERPAPHQHLEELDEICAADVKHVHVEVMSDTCISMILDLADGSQLNCSFYSRNGRAHIAYRADVEGPHEPRACSPESLRQAYERAGMFVAGTVKVTVDKDGLAIVEGTLKGEIRKAADPIILKDVGP